MTLICPICHTSLRPSLGYGTGYWVCNCAIQKGVGKNYIRSDKMILTEQKYRADRLIFGNTEGTYQSFTATVEMEGERKFITVELDNLSRWRSKKEYADYLRWAADEIEKITGR